MTILALCLAIWLVCAIGAAGILFAYFQDRWPNIAEEGRGDDLRFAYGLSLLGEPITLLVALLFCGLRYGWRLR